GRSRASSARGGAPNPAQLAARQTYFLIAGTYMPFVLVSLRGAWGWTLCGVVWGLAALGLAIKLTPLARIRGLSTGSYLAMGWTVLIAIKPVLAHVPLGVSGCCWTADSATR